MPHRDDILNFIHDELNISDFSDYCVNGLQVEGKDNIEKIVLGVSSSNRFFQEAIKNDADMIIVHHGVFWKSDPSLFSLSGILKKRIELLIKNDINLAAYHLPLDAHAEIGNNILILKKLGLTVVEPVDIGWLGEFGNSLSIDDFTSLVNNKLKTKSVVFLYGTKDVSKVLIISGGSSSDYVLAKKYGADTFISGSIKESTVREVEEVKLNYINAGHYNTEKLGIQALGNLLQNKFSIKCQYIDIPNPI